MLVLSRRENERVLFPELGISIQIVRAASGKARLGIGAPPDLSVVREEIASEQQLAEFAEQLVRSADNHNHSHAVRNRMQTVLLSLYLIQKQLANNRVAEAEETLQDLIDELRTPGERAANSPPQPQQARRKALVVEDNSNERRLLAGYLSLSGFEVDAVDDGVKALDYLASHERPDAVVLDMQLPRLGGADAVNVLRSDSRYRGLKVYAVSGMDQRAARVSIGPQGVDHWFSKPLDPQHLVERINAETSPALC
jgi:carbon storage regulator CsrA